MDALDSWALRIIMSIVVVTYVLTAHVALAPGIGPGWLRAIRDIAIAATILGYIWREARS